MQYALAYITQHTRLTVTSMFLTLDTSHEPSSFRVTSHLSTTRKKANYLIL